MVAPPGYADAEPEFSARSIAHISPSSGACYSGFLCLYRDPGFRGGGYAIREGVDLNDFRAFFFNDEMSSWVNATRLRYCWFPDINFSGAFEVMPAGGSGPLLHPWRDNTASALADC
ncbi:peptidase inhibitor family I36 protein [Streptomyces sp. NPDC059985]|uniref:peptidase inhibitor family I36 protein n=1 Tax=Streptomyces sp. NPDC059985 TaxID=3347025 RepID=UPI003677AFA0